MFLAHRVAHQQLPASRALRGGGGSTYGIIHIHHLPYVPTTSGCTVLRAGHCRQYNCDEGE